MKRYYIYILRCNDGSYYTGITNNVERRFYEHQNGLIYNCYTDRRRPVNLVFIEEFGEVNDAIAREKQIKGWTRRKKEAVSAVEKGLKFANQRGDDDALFLLKDKSTPSAKFLLKDNSTPSANKAQVSDFSSLSDDELLQEIRRLEGNQ